MSPMNPIMPVNAMQTEVTSVLIKRRDDLRRTTFIPRLVATSSPADRTLTSTAFDSMTMTQTTTIGIRRKSTPQVAFHIPPMSQRVISRRALSSEKYLAAVTPAWKK